MSSPLPPPPGFGAGDDPANPQPTNPNPYASPDAPHPAGPHEASGGDSTGGVIPYKNPAALIAYYLGLFSLFPCVGILLAVPAVVLGIIGLQKRKANPAVKGSVHAWIGIVLGGLMTMLWGSMLAFSLLAAMQEGR